MSVLTNFSAKQNDMNYLFYGEMCQHVFKPKDRLCNVAEGFTFITD